MPVNKPGDPENTAPEDGPKLSAETPSEQPLVEEVREEEKPTPAPEVTSNYSNTVTGNEQMTNQNPNKETVDPSRTNSAAALMSLFQPDYFNLDQGDVDASRLLETTQTLVAERQNRSARDIRFHVISKSITGNFAVLAVSIPKVLGGVRTIGIHTLILESSRPPIENFAQNTAAGTIEMVVPTAEAYDASMTSVIVNEVKKAYGNEPNTRYRECGFQVVYREVDVKSTEQVGYLLQEATKSIETSIREVETALTGGVKFNLDMISKIPSIRVASRFSLESNESRPNGLPVRSDIVGELVMTQQDSKNPLIPKNQSFRISKSAAYVDVIYAPPAQTFNGYGNNPYGAPAPSYIPRITITQLETDLAGSSLEFMLLGVANLAALNRNRAYGVAFRDTYNRPSSLRNLGALGYQCPHLAKDNTPGMLAIESEQALRILMDTVMYPSPVFTLEIENGGMHNWALNQLANAAKGVPAAVEAVFNAANTLTGGRFAVQLARLAGVPLEQVQSIKLIETTEDQNYLGYFTHEGERRDLRTLDLVAILNIANGDAQLVQDYLATLVLGQEPAAVRLDKRLRIFKKICAEVVIKGYTNKYNFTAFFIEALISAIEASDFKLNASNMLLNPQQQVYTQNVQDWSSMMVNPNVGAGLYQVQQFHPNMAGYYNIGQNYGSF